MCYVLMFSCSLKNCKCTSQKCVVNKSNAILPHFDGNWVIGDFKPDTERLIFLPIMIAHFANSLSSWPSTRFQSSFSNASQTLATIVQAHFQKNSPKKKKIKKNAKSLQSTFELCIEWMTNLLMKIRAKKPQSFVELCFRFYWSRSEIFIGSGEMCTGEARKWIGWLVKQEKK